MKLFLGVLVLVAVCYADETFTLVDDLDLGSDVKTRGSFDTVTVRAPSFKYELPATYAPPRAPPPPPPPKPVYAPPKASTYAPPRAPPPPPPPKPVYAPPPPPPKPKAPVPVYGAPIVKTPSTVFLPAQPSGAAAIFDLTVVDSLPGDFKVKKPVFTGRTLKAGSHEYISPDGHAVSIKYH